MKKTAKTAMTAAMFAASLGASANTACYANTIMQSNAAAVGFDYAETTTMVQPVYGPPEVMQSLFGTTTQPEPVKMEGEATMPITTEELALPGEPVITTTSEDELMTGGVLPIYTTTERLVPEGTSPVVTTTTTTTAPMIDTYPMPLYGPPSVLFNAADMNMDKQLDARDLSKLKQMLLNGYTEVSWGQLGDLDGDHQITKNDIKILQRELTGKPEDEEEENDETRYNPVTTTTTTTTTRRIETVQPVYGPPPAWIE